MTTEFPKFTLVELGAIVAIGGTRKGNINMGLSHWKFHPMKECRIKFFSYMTSIHRLRSVACGWSQPLIFMHTSPLSLYWNAVIQPVCAWPLLSCITVLTLNNQHCSLNGRRFPIFQYTWIVTVVTIVQITYC
jgi:hypothetical protein